MAATNKADQIGQIKWLFPNWQGMGCHTSWFEARRPRSLSRLYEGCHEIHQRPRARRCSVHEGCYVALAQATSEVNAELHQDDDDDLQIVSCQHCNLAAVLLPSLTSMKTKTKTKKMFRSCQILPKSSKRN
ncbi:hypothetical protein TRIUR3_18222 [Triticum urartu]|uniref:Uncharacterized protein n=1 Tax=Triticum urartu TaxID=4572 RepID=M7YXS3_TRIUA|nr:hypothetical protein TRIUR3_18222 [Triticum urartu]